MPIKYKVLLIGSGLMTPPLIDHLLSFKDTHITVVSNLVDQAKALCKRGPEFMDSGYLDVTDQAAISKRVKGYNLVISFVPPWMHMPVLKACVENGVNTCTSSYVSPDMLKLHDEAKAKGLTLLNECGLDPGIDIMGTMKVVNEAKQRGWKVVSYESFCGGLPVAEQADNPLGYKFSWNPGAAIKASRNQAIFFKNGKRVVTDSPLKCVEDRDGYSAAMKFEVYPNRDSTVFMERFKMMDCETFIRGTIRFKGFSGVISAFHDLGLTSDDHVDSSVKTLRDLTAWRMSKCPENSLSEHQRNLLAKVTTGMPQKDIDLT